MDNTKSLLIGVFTGVYLFVAGYFGIFMPLLALVLVLMVTDLITRVYAAWVRPDERPESRKVFQGLYKKLGMCILIFLTLLLDAGLTQIAANLGIQVATKIIFTAFTLAWIFVRELISNLENLAWAGVELPEFVTKALNIAKDKIDSAADEIVGGGDNK